MFQLHEINAFWPESDSVISRIIKKINSNMSRRFVLFGTDFVWMIKVLISVINKLAEVFIETIVLRKEIKEKVFLVVGETFTINKIVGETFTTLTGQRPVKVGQYSKCRLMSSNL